MITVPHPDQFTNHFAGQLAFGRSRILLLSTGDGGGGGDPFNHAQDLDTLQGKLLRLKVLGAGAACGRACASRATTRTPARRPGKGPIWASGLRNAWRFSVDPTTGDLWVADVGQGAFEEVDRIPADRAARTWGGRARRALRRSTRPGAVREPSYLDPVAAYGRDYGTSITGGFVYRGSRYADLLRRSLRRRRLRVGPDLLPRADRDRQRRPAGRRHELRRGRRKRAVGRDLSRRGCYRMRASMTDPGARRTALGVPGEVDGGRGRRLGGVGRRRGSRATGRGRSSMDGPAGQGRGGAAAARGRAQVVHR